MELLFLFLLGNGVVANVVLKNTKGENGGWFLISAGWGMGVFVSVLIRHVISVRALFMQLIPKKGERDSNWDYSWIAVMGPFVGAGIAALLYYFNMWIS